MDKAKSARLDSSHECIIEIENLFNLLFATESRFNTNKFE